MKNFLFLVLVLFTFSLNAQVKHTANINKYGVALDGNDPTSYFHSKPVKGKNEFKSTYNGTSYLFESKENKAQFDKSPQNFEPQYGGWCAYAVGKTDENVEVNPQTYKVLNGKLYLFYNKFFTNTLELWNKDEADLLKNANKNWSK